MGGTYNKSDHPRWASHEIHYGTDEFGFSGLPGGKRWNNGYCEWIGTNGVWWSATEGSTNPVFSGTTGSYHQALMFHLERNRGGVDLEGYPKLFGLSVRCVRDD